MSEQALASDQTYFAFAESALVPKPAQVRQPLKALPDVLCGRYKIERLLGVGGMGAVYRGRDLLREQLGDPAPFVALKALSDEFAEYADGNALLHGEFAMTVRLHHRHIVRCHSFELDRGSERAFIVMEQLRGCTLDHLLLRYPQGLPWAEAREISLALLEALAYAHTQGVLHGDIKPGNLMLDDGNIRLFDFGLGRIVGDDEASLPILARSRFCAWTPRYAAPELIDGGALSMATDIYAVACVIYELCHGQHPYRRFSAKQAQGMSLALAAPTGMPAPVWKVLKRGLAFDVAKRSDSLEPLLAAFRANPASPRFGRWFGRRA